jgi:hypothetical protein
MEILFIDRPLEGFGVVEVTDPEWRDRGGKRLTQLRRNERT